MRHKQRTKAPRRKVVKVEGYAVTQWRCRVTLDCGHIQDFGPSAANFKTMACLACKNMLEEQE